MRIVSANLAHLPDRLYLGDVDVAAFFEAKPAHSLRPKRLLQEILHLIGPARAKPDPRKPERFAGLGNQCMLLLSGGRGLRKIFEDCSASVDILLNGSVETDSFSALKDLVNSGHGMTILPVAHIQYDIQSGSLSHAPLVRQPPAPQLMVSHPADRPTPRLAKFTGSVVTQSAGNLVGRGIWSVHFNFEQDKV